ncbi:MAG TPA: 2-amino-4-hydroxy-6-hydroxymethyldihydropteridine diphosphokinase [Firmicutes bacterium]|nr:2-amino-4-hydroxy-6-hydroxymethyldihydropteridine diphosphokinase [Bacillota bacterium]
MPLVYLGLGSNLGGRAANLRLAAARLGVTGVKITKKSRIYETSGLGVSGHPDYLNACLECFTEKGPEELLDTLESIEKEMGRDKKGEKAPRIIDIDILFYGNIIFKSKTLKIPHPEIHKRKFVLEPFSELAPGFIHPERGESIKAMLDKGIFEEKTAVTGDF